MVLKGHIPETGLQPVTWIQAFRTPEGLLDPPSLARQEVTPAWRLGNPNTRKGRKSSSDPVPVSLLEAKNQRSFLQEAGAVSKEVVLRSRVLSWNKATGLPDRVLFCQSLALCSHTVIYFSSWGLNLLICKMRVMH